MHQSKYINYASFERVDESWSDQIRVVPEEVFDDIHMSLIDIVRSVTHKSSHESARKVRHMLMDYEFIDELGSDLRTYTFRGAGQKPTSVVSMKGVLKTFQYLRDRSKRTKWRKIDKMIITYHTKDKKNTISYEFEAVLDDQQTLAMSQYTTDYKGPPMRPSVEHLVKHQLVTRFVYACETKAFPNAIKIGRATSVRQRMLSGNSFAAPQPLQVVAVAPSLDYVRDEKKAQNHFGGKKIRGEFYNVTKEEVKKYFSDVIKAKYDRDMNSIVNGLAKS